MFLKCSDWVDIWCVLTLGVLLEIRLIISIYREIIPIHIMDEVYPTSRTGILTILKMSRKKTTFFTTTEVFAPFTPNSQNVVTRNKTSTTSASFCTKFHQDRSISLGERVKWWYIDGHTYVASWRNYAWAFFVPFLGPSMHHHLTRSRRIMDRSWWNLVQNEAGVSLVLFLVTTFCGFGVKGTKT